MAPNRRTGRPPRYHPGENPAGAQSRPRKALRRTPRRRRTATRTRWGPGSTSTANPPASPPSRRAPPQTLTVTRRGNVCISTLTHTGTDRFDRPSAPPPPAPAVVAASARPRPPTANPTRSVSHAGRGSAPGSCGRSKKPPRCSRSAGAPRWVGHRHAPWQRSSPFSNYPERQGGTWNSAGGTCGPDEEKSRLSGSAQERKRRNETESTLPKVLDAVQRLEAPRDDGLTLTIDLARRYESSWAVLPVLTLMAMAARPISADPGLDHFRLVVLRHSHHRDRLS